MTRYKLVSDIRLAHPSDHVYHYKHGWIPLTHPAAKQMIHPVRGMPEKETFKGVATEKHRGNTISVRRGRQWGTMEIRINGNSLGSHGGLTNKDAVHHLDSTKGTINDFHDRPSAYTNGYGEVSYGMKKESKAGL